MAQKSTSRQEKILWFQKAEGVAVLAPRKVFELLRARSPPANLPFGFSHLFLEIEVCTTSDIESYKLKPFVD
jgi:hypothetical protein